MTDVSDTARSPADRVNDLPRILQALQQAVYEALLDHKRAGNPVAIWQDGAVKWIAPNDIPDHPPSQESDSESSPPGPSAVRP